MKNRYDRKEKKLSKQIPCAGKVGALPTVVQISGTPRNWMLTGNIAWPQPPFRKTETRCKNCDNATEKMFRNVKKWCFYLNIIVIVLKGISKRSLWSLLLSCIYSRSISISEKSVFLASLIANEQKYPGSHQFFIYKFRYFTANKWPKSSLLCAQPKCLVFFRTADFT